MPENSQTCCICLEKSIYFESVDECLFGDVKYIDKLRLCVPNEIWKEFFNICLECVEKLDNAYSFIQLCLKNEEFRKELLKHKEEKQHYEDAEFICYECNKSFKLKRTLALHITRIHTKPKNKAKWKALIAENSTANVTDDVKNENEVALTLHSVNNQDPGNDDAIKLEDNDDDKDDTFHESYIDNNDFNEYSSEDEPLFKGKKKYKGKKRGPKLKGPQKCPFCELEFTRSDRYVQHVRSKHTFEKPFKCDLCEAKYYSQHNLTIHMRKHRNERPFVCSICGKCFVSSNDLWQHNKIHDSVRQYACEECPRTFKTHSNLRTHKLQMHQDPEMWKFVCTVCGKKFPLNNNLIKHMRRHEGIKDFLCHLCEKKFVEKIDLQTHLLSHSNERHFKCSVCFKEYKKKETLRRHMKIEHDMGNFVVKKPEKKLTCPMCPKIFAFNNKLQRHIITHTGEKPVKCDCCEKRFRDNYDRNSHLRQVHNIEPKNSLVI